MFRQLLEGTADFGHRRRRAGNVRGRGCFRLSQCLSFVKNVPLEECLTALTPEGAPSSVDGCLGFLRVGGISSPTVAATVLSADGSMK